MNIMTYKGLTARVEFDAEDEILVGRIAGINDVVGFHAEDAKGIAAAFHEAVDDYIATCKEVGKEPEKTYSGKMMLRIPPELHRSLAITAELAGKSLNQLCEDALRSLAQARRDERIFDIIQNGIGDDARDALRLQIADLLSHSPSANDEGAWVALIPPLAQASKRVRSDAI